MRSLSSCSTSTGPRAPPTAHGAARRRAIAVSRGCLPAAPTVSSRHSAGRCRNTADLHRLHGDVDHFHQSPPHRQLGLHPGVHVGRGPSGFGQGRLRGCRFGRWRGRWRQGPRRPAAYPGRHRQRQDRAPAKHEMPFAPACQTCAIPHAEALPFVRLIHAAAPGWAAAPRRAAPGSNRKTHPQRQKNPPPAVPPGRSGPPASRRIRPPSR